MPQDNRRDVGACACVMRCHGACEHAWRHLRLGFMETSMYPVWSVCPEQSASLGKGSVGDICMACPLGTDSPAWGSRSSQGAPLTVPWTPKGTFAVARLRPTPLPPLSGGRLPPSSPFPGVGRLDTLEGNTGGRGSCCPLAGDGSIPWQRGPSRQYWAAPPPPPASPGD